MEKETMKEREEREQLHQEPPADEMPEVREHAEVSDEPDADLQTDDDQPDEEGQNKQSNFKRTIWAIAGVYLIYLAYEMYKGVQEDGSPGWFIWLFMVFFIVAGVFLIWQVLKFYLVKSKDNLPEAIKKRMVPVQEDDEKQKNAAPAEAQAQPARDDTALNCKAVILAAGKGTRMKSDLPKVLHEIDGKPLALYVKEAACEAGAQVVCYVIGYQKDRVRIALADRGVTFAVQEEQLGTGHAVKCAKNFIGTQGDVFVLCGDTPLITGETLSRLLEHHRERDNAVTALTALLNDPYGYGRIIRDENGDFVRSVEEKDATEEERQIKESNVGMYVFRAADLSEAVELLNNDNAQGEYYLPDTLMILKGLGRKVDAYCIENTPEILGVNTPEQLADAAEVIAQRQEA